MGQTEKTQPKQTSSGFESGHCSIQLASLKVPIVLKKSFPPDE
jgi:hypothetical protein